MAGLSVASGLKPNLPKTAQQQEQAALQSMQTSLVEEFGAVPAVFTVDEALTLILDEVQAAGDSVGVTHLVTVAPTMPHGYLMEVPNKALGAEPGDFAVQGWWLLATLSGQLHPDVRFMLDAKTTEGHLVIPDTGPNGFRTRILTAVQAHEAGDVAGMEQNHWTDAINLYLGGLTQDSAWFVFEMATSPNHPLANHTTALLNLIRQLNLIQTGAAS